MSNHLEEMEIGTLMSQIFFKISSVVSIKKTIKFLLGRSMSNQPEKMEIDTLTSQIFFKLSSIVGIIKTK